MAEASVTVRDDDGNHTAVTVTDIRIAPGGDGYAADVVDAIRDGIDSDDVDVTVSD